MMDELTLSVEALPTQQLVAANRTLREFYGPGTLESWCRGGIIGVPPPHTPEQFRKWLVESMGGFPAPLRPLVTLVQNGAIPIMYAPGWLESERAWTREYLVLLTPISWYDDLMEQLNVLSDTTVINIVDAEFENITRKKERLTGVEIDRDTRKPSLVINDGPCKWFGLKYFDTSILPLVSKVVADDILGGYHCLTIWDKTPRLSTQIIKILAGFAYSYAKSRQ